MLELPVSISIGVNADAYEILKQLNIHNLSPDYITIDIAHGHSIKMKNMITWIRTNMSKDIYIIAGNVSTPEGVKDLEIWGANGIKVGIGPGSACTTFNATGFGSRGMQAYAIHESVNAKTKEETDIIADGGVKDPGDIVKSIVLGAKMVMVGGMFSALKDSPGEMVVGTDGVFYKEFWGSASAHQSGKKNRIEGTKKLMPMGHKTVLEECEYLHECIQSAISYGGGKDIDCLKVVEYKIRHV
jgi:GMP reductase